jgi:hypothetical protein
MELACDVLIVGGGCGGVAAALAASGLGRQVLLTESGSLLGGQLTSQAVPPDEHPWVESTGITARYRQLRDAVRTRYKQTRRLTKTAIRDPLFNPGAAWVSNLSAEPVIFREVLDDLVRPAHAQGLLRCLMRHRPVEAMMEGDLVKAVTFEDLQTGENVTIMAYYILDATEEGDLLPLTGCESVVGAESAAITGEPHALDGPPDPLDQQAITWCAALTKARELALCFVHWLQTDAPHPDGGAGYPGMRLCPEVLGTHDGVAAAAYVRESRRIAAEFTVLETHVGVKARPGASRAEAFPDTVGVGCYRIDLHPSTAGRGYLDIATYPFEIPLGALLPQRLENLLASGKCLGVTHVTNGCYRLHPVEWNVGEAAGALAAFSVSHRVSPRAVRSSPARLADFQRTLASMGVQLHWPAEIGTKVR